MAATITKFAVTATSRLPVADREANISRPGVPFTAWNESIAPGIEDEMNGSKRFISDLVSTTKSDWITLPIKVDGICTYPSDYPKATLVQLVAVLKGAPTQDPVIVSNTWPVAGTPDSPPPPDYLNIKVVELSVKSPWQDSVCTVPFSLSGDFQWKIIDSKLNKGQTIILNTPVRLEFLWLLGPAIAGPSIAPGSFQRTAVDYHGAYPIRLLRFVLPTIFTVGSAGSAIISRMNYWWLSELYAKLKTCNMIYNTISGRSAFGMGCCGGSFALDDFIDHILRPAGTTAMLMNSFDIAALTQLALTLFVDQDYNELFYTRWTCVYRMGYVLPGIPFGLGNLTPRTITWPPGVNNPWFTGTGTSPNESDKKKINICATRAWLAYDIPNTPSGVIDLSWEVPDGPSSHLLSIDYGSRNLPQWAAVHLENPVSIPGRTYYQDQTFSMVRGEMARFGVYSITGVVAPCPSLSPPAPVPIPWQLRDSIEDLITSSRNHSSSGLLWGYNDASLKAMNVAAVVTQGTAMKLVSRNAASSTTFYQSSGVVRVSYSFNPMPVSASELNGLLAININVYDTFQDAYEGLVFELTRLERDVKDCVVPQNQPGTYGHYTLLTPQSILCMRGNLLLDLTIQGMSKPDSSAITLLGNITGFLDSYISHRIVDSSQVRRPILSIVRSAPPTVSINSAFDVQLARVNEVAGQIKATTSRGSLIMLGKITDDPTSGLCTLSFWVMDKPDMEDVSVDVDIFLAHGDTFHPGKINFSVTVT